MTKVREAELREEYNAFMDNRMDEGLEDKNSDYSFEDYLYDFYSHEDALNVLEIRTKSGVIRATVNGAPDYY